jgi:hypothetical protein
MNIASAATPRTSTAPAPAGLGSLLKPNDPNVKGMPAQDMAAIMARAKAMSDRELADVLEGKSMNIPQFAAMTEAMGRKSLRTAVQGAQAQQQLNKPTTKQQLLTDLQMGGIDQLPAPNMGSVNMAEGGIVAFGNPELNPDEDQVVKTNPELERIYRRAEVLGAPNIFTPKIYDTYQKAIGQPFARFFSASPREQKVAFDKATEARKGERGTFTSAPADIAKDTKAVAEARQKDLKEAKDVQTAKDMKVAGVTPTDIEQAEIGMAMQQMLNQKDTKAAARKQDLASGVGVTPSASQYGLSPEKRTNPFAELKAEAPDYEKIKRQGLGEGLMAISGALFANPNLSRAFGQGMPALAAIARSTSKESKEAQKDYKNYQLNIAKANELFEQGQEDKAFKYAKQAQDHLYHMQSVAAQKMQAGRPAAELQVLQALQRPNEELSDTYARVRQMGQDPKSDQALQLQYAKDPLRFTMSYDQWLKQNFPNYGGQQVASAGNTGYSLVYDSNNRPIK